MGTNTSLGDLRCSLIDDDDLAFLAVVTGLSERTLSKRIRDTHGNVLVRNALEDDWPGDSEKLANLTVAAAKGAGLVPELANASGLRLRTVRKRLDEHHGKTLLGNAFPELYSGDDDDLPDEAVAHGEDRDSGQPRAAASEFQDGRRRFTPVELLGGTKAASVRNADAFMGWLASALGMEVPKVRRSLKRAHGRTLLQNVFYWCWPPKRVGQPPREVMSAMTVASVRRSPALARWAADLMRIPPAVLFSQLHEAAGNARLDTALAKRDPGPARASPVEPARPAPARSGWQTPGTPPNGSPTRSTAEVPASPSGARMVDGRYALGRRLGAGAMGKVYEATRVQEPPELVVIKLEINESAESLRKEIGNAYRLTHQNICSYKDYGQDARFGTYVVLQHGGRSLDEVIDSEDISVAQALDVIRQAAHGIDYAHHKLVMHHDIKPANILVDKCHGGWEVRVTDFGVSVKGHAGANTAGKPTVLATQLVGYTPEYAAPEQLMSGTPRKASDQYSLALVFCSMLEGKPLKRGYKVPWFSQLSERQNRALARALSEDPDARYDSCSEFAAALTG